MSVLNLSMFTSLPTELQQHILSYLPYLALKKLLLVSKSFTTLLAPHAFDKALFRVTRNHKMSVYSPPRADKSLSSKNGDDILVHPFLADLGLYIDYDLAPSISRIEIREKCLSNNPGWLLTSTCIPGELAVWPAAKEVCVAIMDGYLSFLARNEQGVTVEDVMKEMTAFINGKGKRMWQNVGSIGLGCAFKGFEAKGRDEDGAVGLVARFGP